VLLQIVGMENPSVVSSMVDEENQVRYDIYAYRELTREEMVQTIRTYHSSLSRGRARKRVKNTRIQIVTVIGAQL
jgi:hypothetical protein